MPLPDAESVIRAPGPWTHRDVPANGSRFHVADMGQGPAVLLLHGFPTFWWTWRHQLTALAAAGYRAIAMDLRGYGGSDHPPQGYDPRTMANDIAGVIRSLGESDAVIVGHGWGGVGAWSSAVLQPDVVRAVASVSMPHPRVMRREGLRNSRQRSRLRHALGFQLPFYPERSLTAHEGRRIATILREWSATPQWPSEEVCDSYRAAFLRWPTAHTAIEYHRWAGRSSIRPDGLSYMGLMEAPIQRPVLQVHGTGDPVTLLDTVDGTQGYVRGPYSRVDLECGHFPHEEVPDDFNAALVSWLAELP